MTDTPAMIDDDLRALLDGPVSILFATVDSMRTPDVTRGCGAIALDDRRIRVLVSSVAPEVRANVQPGRRCSLLVTDITTYRSIQWKGVIASGCVPRTPGDLALFHRHIDAFRRGAPVVGIPPDEVPQMYPHEVVAVEIEVDARFDQSPGLHAGRRVG